LSLAFSSKIANTWCRYAYCIILFIWVIGLSVGTQFCRGDPALVSSLMRAALESHVSIVGLFCVLFLPLMFSALAVYKSSPWLLLLTVAAKAICFGFAFTAVGYAFENAAWIVRILLLFSDFVGIVLLLWFSLRHSPRQRASFLSDLTGCICVGFLTGAIDLGLISPFAVALIKG